MCFAPGLCWLTSLSILMVRNREDDSVLRTYEPSKGRQQFATIAVRPDNCLYALETISVHMGSHVSNARNRCM